MHSGGARQSYSGAREINVGDANVDFLAALKASCFLLLPSIFFE
jgi:hypothetical protein